MDVLMSMRAAELACVTTAAVTLEDEEERDKKTESRGKPEKMEKARCCKYLYTLPRDW